MSEVARLSPQKRLLLEVHLARASGLKRSREIEPRPPDATVPITAGQRDVWLHAAMAPGVPLYNEALTIHRFGDFDRATLERSFAELVRRHEIWRTCFRSFDGALQQIVGPVPHFEFPWSDLSHFPPSKREQTAIELATADARIPFDLARLPLLRGRIVRLAPDHHCLYLTLHHIIFDGVTIYRTVVPELARLYAAYAARREPDLPPPRLQYGDYAVWHAHQVSDKELARQLEYWRDQLRGDLPVLQLPADRPRPAQPSWRGGMETFALSKTLSDALKELSRRENVTTYTILLTAFKTLLYRYSGQEDIIVGGATDMRHRPELADVAGYFLNSLALRSRPSGAKSFRAYLREIQDTMIGALDASTVPFDRVVREVQCPRVAGAHPVFQVLFSVEPPPPVLGAGWDLTQMDVTVGVAKFDLYLEMDERPTGFIGRFLYSADLFEAATIRRMVGHFLTLLEAAIANPQCALGRLPLLTVDEKRKLLIEINATSRDYPDATLPERFDVRARQTPDATAITCDGRNLTYGELRARIDSLAARLAGAGVRRGSLIGVMLERSFDMVAGLLAILRTGGAWLPLDPRLPPARLAMLIGEARPSIVLTETGLLDRVPSTEATIVVCDGVTDTAAAGPTELLCTPDDTAYVLYTSGSTGRPKAVEIRHRSLTNLLAAFEDALLPTPADTLLAVTTLSFDIAALELFLPLTTGGRLLLATREQVEDPASLLALLPQATIMQGTPATWRALLAAGWTHSPGLTILCGGEALAHELGRQLLDRSEAVWNVYGPTETTIWSLIHKVRREDDPVPVGGPLANTTVWLLDANGEPVPAGVVGELHIGGAGLARGYRNDPDLTARKFCTLPSVSAERLYRTGDFMRFRADGLLEFQGRTDNQVKIRGFRVAMEEVEAAIGAHPDVAAAAVRAIADASGESSLVAFVVPKNVGQKGAIDVAAYLTPILPVYMIPSRTVTMPALPMTPNGKVDRAKLAVLPQPSACRSAGPRDEVETTLVRLWEKLLGGSSIGIHDDFFAVGGHSLLAALLIGEINRTMNRNLPIATLFRAPTIARLAEALRTAQEPPFSHLVGLRTEGRGRPLFIVHGIFGNVLQLFPLAERLRTERPIYALQARGSDLRLEPHATIAGMAEAYIAAIRTVQPRGPYALSGYSFGGLIAFEMACRLVDTGEDVDVMALLETDLAYRNLLLSERFAHHWRRFGRVLNALKSTPLGQWPRDLAGRIANASRRLVRREYIEELDNTAELPAVVRARNQTMYRIHVSEFRNYRPRFFPGVVSVFSSGDAPSEVCDPLPIWRRKTRDVKTYTIAGEHGAIMSRDNVDSVAREFSRCLGACDGRVAPCALRRNPATDERGARDSIAAAAVG